MSLKKYDNLPEFMKNNEVKEYYDILNKRRGQLALKRALDFIGGLIGTIVLSPIMIILAIVIKCESKGPALFKQVRVTQYGREFKIFKFRTMVVNAEKLGTQVTSKDDPRVTKVGKFIRKTSLDELPQLFNVLKGDMSLVGPRPPIPREVIQYNKYQYQRLLVKPGITCYWQISGRNNIDFDEWVELDLKYIKERNLFKDIYIILMTLPVLLGDKNAS